MNDNGSSLFVYGGLGNIYIFDGKTLEAIAEVEIPGNDYNHIYVSADDKYILTTSWVGTKVYKSDNFSLIYHNEKPIVNIDNITTEGDKLIYTAGYCGGSAETIEVKQKNRRTK